MRIAAAARLAALALLVHSSVALATAELTVSHETLEAGAQGVLVVQGMIADEQTFGIEVVVELVPRAGARGTVVFTPAPPVDIVELGDPWPARGNFSPFDTDITPTTALNGFVGDDGAYLPAAVAFDGDLAAFPFVASADANGVWDVVLVGSAGASAWVDVPTTLMAGSVTVLGDPVPASTSWSLATMASALLLLGLLILRRRGRTTVPVAARR